MSKNFNIPDFGFFTTPDSSTAASIPDFGFITFTASDNLLVGSVDTVVYSSQADLARDWIEKQYQTFIVNSGASMEVANQTFETANDVRIGDNGNITATFSLQPALSSTLCPLSINTPSPASVIDSGFLGDINGILDSTLVGSGAQFQVAAYVKTDIEYLQWTADVASDYTFVGSGNSQAGEWRLRIINVSSGNTEILPYWDNEIDGLGHYDNMFSEYWKVTDIPYLQESKRLLTGNSLNHDTTSGSTFLKIVDSADTQFARWNTRTGLCRSYVLDATNSDWGGGDGVGFEERAYLYDNALAMLVLAKRQTDIDHRVRASQIGNALVRMQDSNGAWPFSQNHMAVTGADKYYRTGAVAWGAYACLKTYSIFSFNSFLDTSVDMEGVKQAGKSALDYMLTLIRPEFGTVSGGSGTYTSGVFSESAIIPWHSTEHNIDAWYAFYLGGEVFDSAVYRDTAQGIINGLLEHHWDSVEGKFWQGIGSDGVPDSQGALDVHTWGTILLQSHLANGRIDSIWPRVSSNYAVVVSGATGYKPYSPNEGYPGAVDALWAEGTFGEIYAKQMHGRASVSSLGHMVTFQESSGAFTYSVNRADLTYEINSYESLASTTWFLLVAEQDNFIWDETPYSVLASDWFKDEIATKTPDVHRKLIIGSSNYVDRVIRWPTIKRSIDKIKPVSVSIPLANDDKALNYFFTDSSFLGTDCTLQMGLVNLMGSEENINLFKGTIEGLTTDGGVLTLSMMDRFKGFSETLLGDTSSDGALQFVDSDHLPADLLWTIITSYGGLDNTEDNSNPDIDYQSFIDWGAIFEGDSIRINAKFTGEKIIEVVQEFGEMLDSNFMFENNKLRFYRGSIQTSSFFTDLGDDKIKRVTSRLNDKDIMNKKHVEGGWAVDSDYSTINVINEDATSQTAFGVREDRLSVGAIWFVDSASAINLAERYIFKQKNPLLQYEIRTGLTQLPVLNGDGLLFADDQLDVTSSTEFFVEGTNINMDTGEMVTTTRNMPQLKSFILDINTYSVLDQDYNFLL